MRSGALLALLVASAVAAGCGGAGPSDPKLVVGGYLGVWSPDSRWIAIPDPHGIKLLPADGSESKLVRVPRPAKALGWSSDGRKLYFLTRTGPSQTRGVWASSVGVDGRGLEQVPLRTRIQAAAWARGGWPLVFIPGTNSFGPKGRIGPEPDIWVLHGFDAKLQRTLELKGTELDPEFSPDGKHIVFEQLHRSWLSVWWVSTDESDSKQLVGNLVEGFASVSPDGHTVAVNAVTKNGDRRLHLYTQPIVDGQLGEVTDEEIHPDTPVWSPDGGWIAYSNYNGEIKLIHPDGSDEHVIGRFPGYEIFDLNWSPDGTHLAYTTQKVVPET